MPIRHALTDAVLLGINQYEADCQQVGQQIPWHRKINIEEIKTLLKKDCLDDNCFILSLKDYCNLNIKTGYVFWGFDLFPTHRSRLMSYIFKNLLSCKKLLNAHSCYLILSAIDTNPTLQLIALLQESKDEILSTQERQSKLEKEHQAQMSQLQERITALEQQRIASLDPKLIEKILAYQTQRTEELQLISELLAKKDHQIEHLQQQLRAQASHVVAKPS